ncbi:hypothetical protein B0H10DRAFT_545777 [Mycena sp. CBHHK59/15]|nr:hypothetical protein B0H10DRAFT_807372 [Mycena sp. CBHHK59/15]KAJ6607658.1 hypothetical protein B0H10DRAFT_545777 [Mycena sp. CBHHK59/15]
MVPRRAGGMALAGKAAGKDVGMWFGPNAPAAGALRRLVEACSACGLGVSVTIDGTFYQTEVFTASHSPSFAPSSPSGASVSSHGHSHGSGSKKGKESKKWGDWPVLYERIKLLHHHTTSSAYRVTVCFILTLTTLAPQSLLPSQHLQYRGRLLHHHTGTTRSRRIHEPRIQPQA